MRHELKYFTKKFNKNKFEFKAKSNWFWNLYKDFLKDHNILSRFVTQHKWMCGMLESLTCTMNFFFFFFNIFMDG